MLQIARRDHWPEVQFRGNMPRVVVIASATIWLLFGSFLILQLTQRQPLLHRTAMTLLAAEFVALMMDGLGSPPVAAVGHSAASIDVPLLAVGMVVVAIMRAWPSRGADEDPRHGFARQGWGRGRLGARGRRARGDRV
jgi:hypothetical protein